MNVLLTGGLGFIGHEVAQILSVDHTVTIVDNLTDYGFISDQELDPLIKERQSLLSNVNVKIGDIRDQQFIRRVVEYTKPDVVVHLASFPRQKVVRENPQEASTVMSTGLINLIEASKGVSKFVYVSSSMVYGDFNDMVKETHECQPIGQYAIMKLMGEQLVKDYHRQGYFDYAIVRPSAVYGPRDVVDRVVSKFLMSAINNQTLTVKGANEVLDFTYVTDTAQGIALVATKTCNYDTYNITRCEKDPVTLRMAAERIVEIVGQGQFQFVDRDLNFPTRGRLCIDRAQEDLGYEPRIEFTKGIKNYLDWIEHANL